MVTCQVQEPFAHLTVLRQGVRFLKLQANKGISHSFVSCSDSKKTKLARTDFLTPWLGARFETSVKSSSRQGYLLHQVCEIVTNLLCFGFYISTLCLQGSHFAIVAYYPSHGQFYLPNYIAIRNTSLPQWRLPRQTLPRCWNSPTLCSWEVAPRKSLWRTWLLRCVGPTTGMQSCQNVLLVHTSREITYLGKC